MLVDEITASLITKEVVECYLYIRISTTNKEKMHSATEIELHKRRKL